VWCGAWTRHCILASEGLEVALSHQERNRSFWKQRFPTVASYLLSLYKVELVLQTHGREDYELQQRAANVHRCSATRCREAPRLQPAGSEWIFFGAHFGGELWPPWEVGGRVSWHAGRCSGGSINASRFDQALRELSIALCQGNYLMIGHRLGWLLELMAGAPAKGADRHVEAS
jgi:hypothetical protein